MRTVLLRTLCGALWILLLNSCATRNAPHFGIPDTPGTVRLLDPSRFAQVFPKSCGSNTKADAQKKRIDKRGGTVDSKKKHRIRILPLALADDRDIEIDDLIAPHLGVSVKSKSVTGEEVADTLYPPAILTIKLGNCKATEGKSLLIAQKQPNGSWKPVRLQWHDTTANTLSGYLPTFSEYALAEP